ncbi:MAG: class I SAM-dependent methyltransferase [Betaproteobacteria bacterium]
MRQRQEFRRRSVPAAPTPSDGALREAFETAASLHTRSAEIAWYASHLPRDAGMLLDAMTGTGRMLLPLLEAGFNVHGADASETALARCGARLSSAGRGTELFRQSITALNLPFRYAAAFISAGAFQSLTHRAAALDALLRIRAHLIDPGLLLLDLFVPEEAAHPPGAPVVELSMLALADGSQLACRSETVIDVPRRRSIVRSRFEQRARTVLAREDHRREITWYAEDEIVALVGDAGYRDVRCEPLPWRSGARARQFAVSARS